MLFLPTPQGSLTCTLLQVADGAENPIEYNCEHDVLAPQKEMRGTNIFEYVDFLSNRYEVRYGACVLNIIIHLYAD